jgi:cytochrome c-type biogenesis protein CcmF
MLPIGLALLVLMAIGPALPWRKTTVGTLRDRLTVPAAVGVLVAVITVAMGVRGIGAVLAFGLGGFAATSNVRQLVLAARGAHRRGLGAWRGLVGRANGGMVVHIGVVVIAVALAAATSLAFRGQVTLRPGTSTVIDGQRITFERLATVSSPARTATEALVLVDGHGPYRPAVSQFGANTDPVGTPAIDSNVLHDVYLTINFLPAASNGPVGIGVIVQPLVVWLWVGGAILVLGSVLAIVPGRRRRPTDPVSSPVPALADGDGHRRPRQAGDGPVDVTVDVTAEPERGVPVALSNAEDGRTDERVPAGSP